MKIGSVVLYCGMMGGAAASSCTEPTACTLEGKTAVTLRVRSPSGDDVTQTARVDVTRNGVALPQGGVRYPGSTGEPISIGAASGNYSVIVHNAGDRDTTVTASVMDAQCGAVTVALKVNLTAL